MNKKIGDDYEKLFLQKLTHYGWWCHLFAYKAEGQPCDVVAVRNNECYLIDVKHCSEMRFSFDKIQPNQRTCFELALRKGNTNCGFAIYFEKIHEWKWLSYDQLKVWEQFEDAKSISCHSCECWKWN